MLARAWVARWVSSGLLPASHAWIVPGCASMGSAAAEVVGEDATQRAEVTMSHVSGRMVASGLPTVPTTLAILSCPPALCPHVEFAVAAVLATPVRLQWTVQPVRPATFCATAEGRAEPGTAGRLAARLRAIDPISFEVVEGPAPTGERYSFAPSLGLFRADLAPNGDITVPELRLRDLLDRTGRSGADSASLAAGLDRLLGAAWDDELEPLRRAGEGAAVTFLRRTG